MSNNKFRPIEAAENAAENVKSKAKGKLLDWLPRFECKHCGALCEADTQYVESQAIYCEVWDCPNCEKRYFREEDSPMSFEMWDR